MPFSVTFILGPQKDCINKEGREMGCMHSCQKEINDKATSFSRLWRHYYFYTKLIVTIYACDSGDQK